MYADLELNQKAGGAGATGDVVYSSNDYADVEEALYGAGDYAAVTTFDEESQATYSTIQKRGSEVIYTTNLDLGTSGVAPPQAMAMRMVSEDVGMPEDDQSVTY